MLLVCCLCAAYMLFMRWLCAVCVLVAREKVGQNGVESSRNRLEGISEPSRRNARVRSAK